MATLCAASSFDGDCVKLRARAPKSRTALECAVDAEDVATFAALSRAENPVTRVYAREALLRRGAMTMDVILDGLTDPAIVEHRSGCVVDSLAAAEPAFVALLLRDGPEADAWLAGFLESDIARRMFRNPWSYTYSRLLRPVLSGHAIPSQCGPSCGGVGDRGRGRRRVAARLAAVRARGSVDADASDRAADVVDAGARLLVLSARARFEAARGGRDRWLLQLEREMRGRGSPGRGGRPSTDEARRRGGVRGLDHALQWPGGPYRPEVAGGGEGCRAPEGKLRAVVRRGRRAASSSPITGHAASGYGNDRLCVKGQLDMGRRTGAWTSYDRSGKRIADVTD
ncbi:MAG: hypothetical protein U0168_04560 [Nannocystaceae bacterium]